MSPHLFLWKKEKKNLSEPLISLKQNHSRMKEGIKKMLAHELSSPVYEYVRSIYKGSGETLGSIAAQARSFESDMNAYFDELKRKEDLEDVR